MRSNRIKSESHQVRFPKLPHRTKSSLWTLAQG